MLPVLHTTAGTPGVDSAALTEPGLVVGAHEHGDVPGGDGSSPARRRQAPDLGRDRARDHRLGVPLGQRLAVFR